MSIEVKNLTKIYGEQKAVNSISFNIKRGEIVGFLGPNGAGKSTTMKMLTTYIAPSSGEATVAGYDVYTQAMNIKRSVGYLPESNPLYYDMYVREYLHFAARVHRIPKAGERVDEVIALTGLTKEVRKKIGTLSKGYKQRVGIAQAIIHNPEVLILDEPTSGLDPNQIEEIRNLIINIGKDKSVMLSTHIMQEVEAMCGRVIIINEGRIVKDELLHTATATGKGATTIEVVFSKGTDAALLQAALKAKQVRQTDAHARIFLITAEEVSKVKKLLLEFALKNDVEIDALNEHSESLEDIFKRVTHK